jgi:hypothetical protein
VKRKHSEGWGTSACDGQAEGARLNICDFCGPLHFSPMMVEDNSPLGAEQVTLTEDITRFTLV